jgi:hypothetical protein
VRGDPAGFETQQDIGNKWTYFALTPGNAAELRHRLPWLRPVPLGTQASFGFGDRLGYATPGHVRAVDRTGIAPLFAQQSVRENARTGRTPQQVLDDAMWGAFEAGWQGPWGADADHLKHPQEIKTFVDAGYTFYTIDPGEYVDPGAGTKSIAKIREAVTRLPWGALESSIEDIYARYLGKRFDLGESWLAFDELTLLRAVAKYGRAVAHVANMYQSICDQFQSSGNAMGQANFDCELSVDETDQPTTIEEHYWIAAELQRLGARMTSLAPRFPGRFEKGVDFQPEPCDSIQIGLERLDHELASHARVARALGGYKLSLHSGSDKFLVYPLFARHCQDRFHVKTAGTSYLEMLRVVATYAPALFREILELARECYPQEQASYQVSAQVERIPLTQALSTSELPALLEDFNARQLLHVTYGVTLARFGSELQTVQTTHAVAYHTRLMEHFQRHLAHFIREAI